MSGTSLAQSTVVLRKGWPSSSSADHLSSTDTWPAGQRKKKDYNVAVNRRKVQTPTRRNDEGIKNLAQFYHAPCRGFWA